MMVTVPVRMAVPVGMTGVRMGMDQGRSSDAPGQGQYIKS
jgi:hypothetical protein